MKKFRISVTSQASAAQIEEGVWRLSVPGGEAGEYRLAQLDDYKGLSRPRFPHRSPFRFQLEARASAAEIPGTWGFGLWNDPFSLTLGLGGGRKFPALPNAVWFFFASPPNHLSFRDDLPASGPLAATFRSPKLPLPVLALGIPFLPLLAWRPTARLLRAAARLFIQQDAAQLSIDPTDWHTYSFEWQDSTVVFSVDGEVALTTKIVPRGPLGLVLWIDNQYAAFNPDGSLGYGALENQAGWIEVRGIEGRETGNQDNS